MLNMMIDDRVEHLEAALEAAQKQASLSKSRWEQLDKLMLYLQSGESFLAPNSIASFFGAQANRYFL